MAFIVVLIAVVLERFVGSWHHLRSWGWLPRYAALLDRRFGKRTVWSPAVRLLAIILPILIIVAIIQAVLNDARWLWIRFIFDLVVLIYCLGPRNFYAAFRPEVKPTVEADEESEAIGLLKVSPENQDSSKYWLVEINRALFSVLFWFVLLGPLGAVLVRLCEQNQPGDPLAQTITQLLEWIPARLFAFTYALVGNFVAVIPVWLTTVISSWEKNEEVLEECGVHALGDVMQNDAKATQGLLDRSLVVWVIVLALIVLI